jgi:hypothetical protein
VAPSKRKGSKGGNKRPTKPPASPKAKPTAQRWLSDDSVSSLGSEDSFLRDSIRSSSSTGAVPENLYLAAQASPRNSLSSVSSEEDLGMGMMGKLMARANDGDQGSELPPPIHIPELMTSQSTASQAESPTYLSAHPTPRSSVGSSIFDAPLFNAAPPRAASEAQSSLPYLPLAARGSSAASSKRNSTREVPDLMGGPLRSNFTLSRTSNASTPRSSQASSRGSYIRLPGGLSDSGSSEPRASLTQGDVDALPLFSSSSELTEEANSPPVTPKGEKGPKV